MLIWVVSSLLILSASFANELATDAREMYDFFKGNKTFIKDPLKLRDPFKRRQAPRPKGYRSRSKLLVNDSFSNFPDITGKSLSSIKITGVLLGKNRRAVAKVGGGSDVYILKEGMTLGKNDLEIKAILPGGIVLVEKILNVYGQEEYIETIIPISSNENKVL